MRVRALCCTLQSGELLLTSFIRFLVQCTLHKQEDQWPLNKQLIQHAAVIHALLTRKPSLLAHHAEEQSVLTLLCSLAYPKGAGSPIIGWARALIERGASLHTRGMNDDTPLQSWCRKSAIQPAGVRMLLEAGADLSESHPRGETAVWHLCSNKNLVVLQQLAAAGWLESADVVAPLVRARELQTSWPGDNQLRHIIELLSSQQQVWPTITQPALVAHLSVPEQLVPELANLIASYLDVGQSNVASAAAAAAQP